MVLIKARALLCPGTMLTMPRELLAAPGTAVCQYSRDTVVDPPGALVEAAGTAVCQHSRDRMQGMFTAVVDVLGLLLMQEGRKCISDLLFERLPARVWGALDPAALGNKTQEQVTPGPKVSGSMS